MHTRESDPIETIRLSEKDRIKLLNQVDQLSNRPVAACRRALRVRFNASGVLVNLAQPNGAMSRLSVLPRNLSSRGLAFIHGRFIYPDVPVEVTLPTLDGELMQVHGKVRNCRHISGIVHEVSIVFSTPVDLRMFVKLSAEEEAIYEAELPEEIVSREQPIEMEDPSVLVVDDSPLDRRLFALWLKKMSLEPVECGNIEDALRQIRNHPFDLAIVDMKLGAESGIDLITQMRESGFQSPIIAASSDGSELTQSHASNAGGNTYLVKPFTREELEQTVSQLSLLGVGGDDESAVFSTDAEDPEMRPLLLEYVAGMGRTVQKLREAIQHNDLETLRSITHNLKGTGSGYGFGEVTSIAANTLSLATDAGAIDQTVRDSVSELIALLRRVKA